MNIRAQAGNIGGSVEGRLIQPVRKTGSAIDVECNYSIGKLQSICVRDAAEAVRGGNSYARRGNLNGRMCEAIIDDSGLDTMIENDIGDLRGWSGRLKLKIRRS